MLVLKVIPREEDSTKVPEALAQENNLTTVPEVLAREIPPRVVLLSILPVLPLPRVRLLLLARRLRC